MIKSSLFAGENFRAVLTLETISGQDVASAKWGSFPAYSDKF